MNESVTAKNLSLLAFWGVSSGIIYLASYWGEFGLNPFEYIDAQGLFQAGLLSLTVSSASLFLGAAIGHVLAGPVFPAGGGAGTPVGRWLSSKARFFAAANLIAITLVVLIAGNSAKWYVVASLASLFSLWARDLPVLAVLSRKEEVRFVLASILIAIPIVAIGVGKRDAAVAASSQSSQVVDLAASVLPSKDVLVAEVTYLGRLGDVYVLFEATNHRALLLDSASAPQLVLRRRVLPPNKSSQRAGEP